VDRGLVQNFSTSRRQRLSVSYGLRDYGPSFDIFLTPMTTFESCFFEALSARRRLLRGHRRRSGVISRQRSAEVHFIDYRRYCSGFRVALVSITSTILVLAFQIIICSSAMLLTRRLPERQRSPWGRVLLAGSSNSGMKGRANL